MDNQNPIKVGDLVKPIPGSNLTSFKGSDSLIVIRKVFGMCLVKPAKDPTNDDPSYVTVYQPLWVKDYEIELIDSNPS